MASRGAGGHAVLATVPISDTGLSVSFIMHGGLYQRLSQMKGRRVRWSRVEQIMQRYYATMAAEIQAMVVQEQQRARERPQASTGRLETATLDERNRSITRDGFGVGVGGFLDKSQAKYWRQIEHGYTGHIGRHVYGIFGETMTGGFRKGKRYKDWRNATAGPAWSFVGAATGGSFMPKDALTARVRREHFTGPHTASRNTRMIIGKQIDAQRSYKAAFERFRKGNKAFWIFRDVVMAELGLTSDQAGRSYDSLLRNFQQ